MKTYSSRSFQSNLSFTQQKMTTLAENPFQAYLVQIQNLKTRLNAAKDSLDRPDFNELKRRDPWEYQGRQFRNQILKDYNAQHVTKAWLKMYEILNLPWVRDAILKFPGVNGFFNAELPGGFIFAANHFLRVEGKPFNWVVASYYPRPESQEGANFLEDTYKLVQNNPQNSLVGTLETNRGRFWSDGNLTHIKVPTILAQLARSKFNNINLYTADGGFDVAGQENIQEELTYQLVLGEVECGLRSLNEGGIFILKIFTFFTPQLMTLLILLRRLFRQSDILKPNSSGRINSESYFIGVGFNRSAGNSVLNMIVSARTNPNTLFVIPTSEEINYVLQKQSEFFEQQILNIQAFLNRQSIPFTVQLNVQSLPNKFHIL